MVGLPALDLWDIVIEVPTFNQPTLSNPIILAFRKTGATFHSKTKTQEVKRRQKVEQLSDVDFVPTNTHSSQGESQLYIFEDNEAVIKMIIQGRNPTCPELTESLLIGCLTGSI